MTAEPEREECPATVADASENKRSITPPCRVRPVNLVTGLSRAQGWGEMLLRPPAPPGGRPSSHRKFPLGQTHVPFTGRWLSPHWEAEARIAPSGSEPHGAVREQGEGSARRWPKQKH